MSGLRLFYDFMQVNSTIIPDISGNGNAGVIRNYDAGGATIVQDNIYGQLVNAINFPGLTDGGYIQFPDGILKDTKGLTVSCWLKPASCSNTYAVFSFGKDQAFFLTATYDALSSATSLRAAVTTGGRSQEQATKEVQLTKPSKWYLLTVTLEADTGKISLYLDGVLKEILEQKRLPYENLLHSTECFIGNSLLYTPPMKGRIADFRLYPYALRATEVFELFSIPDSGRVNADIAQLQYEADNDPLIITSSLSFPITGTYGSFIKWHSSHSHILSNEGSINRPPAGHPDVLVTMTAQVSFANYSESKEFHIKVLAEPTNEMIVEHDINNVTLNNLDFLYDNIKLPSTGEWGSNFHWESSRADLLSRNGTVIRPSIGEKAETAELILHASLGTAFASRNFTAVIIPHFKQPEIIKTEEITLITTLDTLPLLPSRIRVSLEDNKEIYLPVSWEPVSKNLLESPGLFCTNGKVAGYDYPVKATVTVLPSSEEVLKNCQAFPLDEIVLNSSSPYTDNRERTLDYLLLLDDDRMLYNFRAAYGNDTKGAKPLGGWEEPSGLLRGHSTGHYLSALALAYGSTQDSRLMEKINYLITELHTLSQLSQGSAKEFKTLCSPSNAAQSNWSSIPAEWGKGFLSAYSPDQFALLEQFTAYPTIWAPYYTLHKILAGLLDCYEYAGSKTALQIAEGIGDWVSERLSVLPPEQRAKMWSMYIAGEYGGINESLAQLYFYTGSEHYLSASKMFDNPKVFDGLVYNKDTISGIHVNQHIPQIIGALKEFQATKEHSYYLVARYFWHLSVKHYMYSIGGLGRGENFKEPDILAGNIETDRNCETCAVYNMLKLTKELYCYEPDNSEYMDYYERGLINQILASQNPVVTTDVHNGVTYMLPIGPGEHKEYSNDYEDFTCCHGTGMENHVKYQSDIYQISSDDLTVYVNLYIPSDLNWTEKGIRITQSGQFPSETSTFTVSGSNTFTLKFRIPYWVQKDFEVTINGNTQTHQRETSGYFTISRSWSDNDTITFHFPYSVHLDYTPDKLEGYPVASIMYGPLVMVAVNDTKEFLTLTFGPELEEYFLPDWSSYPYPCLNFKGLNFIPMFTAHNMSYHTYFKINIPY
ncbi:MAG: putative glycosylase [Anaerocolumna sp.]|jgi:DUF1680 family protein|nr:putative glycosylase [Anaerocolumna sp.]